VFDNSAEPVDLKVYGKYKGIERCARPYIYVQDDDCIVAAAALLDHYWPGERLCNMSSDWTSAYDDFALLGYGAIFPRDDPARAFRRYWRGASQPDDEFLRRADVVFTALAPFRRVHVGHENLPWATGPDRIHTGEVGFSASRVRMLERAIAVRHRAM
jgi:hypothetical protein